MEEFHSALHAEIVTCAVCDQMCPVSAGKFIFINQLPKGFLSPLSISGDSTQECHALHPLLIDQYDLTSLLNDTNFKGLFLSPRGLKSHETSCADHSGCICIPRLFICQQFGCHQALSRRSLPKNAIANGNWIGNLPKEVIKRKRLQLLCWPTI